MNNLTNIFIGSSLILNNRSSTNIHQGPSWGGNKKLWQLFHQAGRCWENSRLEKEPVCGRQWYSIQASSSPTTGSHWCGGCRGLCRHERRLCSTRWPSGKDQSIMSGWPCGWPLGSSWLCKNVSKTTTLIVPSISSKNLYCMISCMLIFIIYLRREHERIYTILYIISCC